MIEIRHPAKTLDSLKVFENENDRMYPLTLMRCPFFNILSAKSLRHCVDIFSLCSILKIEKKTQQSANKRIERENYFYTLFFDELSTWVTVYKNPSTVGWQSVTVPIILTKLV